MKKIFKIIFTRAVRQEQNYFWPNSKREDYLELIG